MATPFSNYIRETRARYLADVAAGRGRDWTVVMGNEAGDLDSIASALGYAWFASTVKSPNTPAVALIQTPRADLPLRPENVHAFALAGLSGEPTKSELLCIDDVPTGGTPTCPSNRFALVDHNRIIPRFTADNPDARVVAVIDHHDDEKLYHDSADPRIVEVPTGSCASLVARYIRDQTVNAAVQLPQELATLLLCAVVIDTGGLKPGGKGEKADHEAVAFLLPRSTFASAVSVAALQSLAVASSEKTASAGDDTGLHLVPTVQELTWDLSQKKIDIKHLSTVDLLRRDYKQYGWTQAGSADAEKATVQVGLSTVPLGLGEWLQRDGEAEFKKGLHKWLDERGLDVLGVLTTFREEVKKGEEKKKDKKGKKGKEGKKDKKVKKDKDKKSKHEGDIDGGKQKDGRKESKKGKDKTKKKHEAKQHDGSDSDSSWNSSSDSADSDSEDSHRKLNDKPKSTHKHEDKDKKDKEHKLDKPSDESEMKKSKHSRQILLAVRPGRSGDALSTRLWTDLKESRELEAKETSLEQLLGTEKGETKQDTEDLLVRVYKQGNVHATRKIIAPLLQRFVEIVKPGE